MFFLSFQINRSGMFYNNMGDTGTKVADLRYKIFVIKMTTASLCQIEKQVP